jgi:DNA-binding helix-hairpin-helix protein with protein kinase domain
MVFRGQKGNYSADTQLGVGGEGTVYTISDHNDLVLKIYKELPNTTKVRKLMLMTSMVNNRLDQYTAWVKDVVCDEQNRTCGFVMKKLTDYVPLHMLFNPMDRKKLFPDKGYNFLVHVAKNLATAFYACHSCSLVIGDVNEGNILVNEQGMIRFIDCDSFQLKDVDAYHYCEVGVPRYTPPELLDAKSFANIIRTVNTDSFSLAVLIFQLLFLGRHPYAGKNFTDADIEEELAIRNHWFAYSLRNRSNKLAPPADTFDFKSLTPGLIEVFHEAFETIERRPTPEKIIMELDGYLKELKGCSKSKIHSYPSKLNHCPWCNFEKKNIFYFLDENYLKSVESLSDIEQFVNGFRVEKINIDKVEIPNVYPTQLIPYPVDLKYKNFKWYNWCAIGGSILAGILLYPLSGWFVVVGVITSLFITKVLPWKSATIAERLRYENELKDVKLKLDSAVKEHNFQKLQAYFNSSTNLEKLVTNYRRLPDQLNIKKKETEERIYHDQLHAFLFRFDIRNHEIQSFGATRKLALHTAGIRNASEISKLNQIKVAGVGPKFEQILFSWQRKVSSNFVYHPDQSLISREFNLIVQEIKQTKFHLENEIKKEYRLLQTHKLNITIRSNQLKKNIEILTRQYFQAQVNKAEFEAVIS